MMGDSLFTVVSADVFEFSDDREESLQAVIQAMISRKDAKNLIIFQNGPQK